MTKAQQHDEQADEQEPEGYPFATDPEGFIDATDQHAVAAYIDQYGFEAFQTERQRQVGTLYGGGIA